MSVKFLSDEWAQALKTELNANDAFRQAAAGQNATIQQVIADGGEDTHYWIKIADGTIDMGIGDVDAPDATITQGYETAVKLAKSELSAVTAFMTGKIKIAREHGPAARLAGCPGAAPRRDRQDRRRVLSDAGSAPVAHHRERGLRGGEEPPVGIADLRLGVRDLPTHPHRAPARDDRARRARGQVLHPQLDRDVTPFGRELRADRESRRGIGEGREHAHRATTPAG